MQTIQGTPIDVLPQNIESEAALLGALILNNTVAGEVIEILHKDDFYRPSHRRLYETLVDLFINQQMVDSLILKNALEKRGWLEDVGGAEYIAELIDSVPSAANALHYARIIRERATLRTLMQKCSDIVREASQSTTDVDELVDRAEQIIFDIGKKRGARESTRIGDILRETFNKIKDIRDRKARISGLSTGFYEMDDKLSGFQPAQFIVVAGRPSMGKTSLVLKIMESIGLDQAKPVLLFSVETTGSQIAETMLCSHCRISSHRLRKGLITEEEFQKLLLAAGRFHEAPIFIDDSSDLTVLELRARARRMKAEHDIQCIFVDYLQLINTRQAENRQQEIATISRSLKALAKELNIPVVTLSQLNRAAEGREGNKPRLADLRESGAIEQDADVVLLLYRDEYYHPSDTEQKGICDITVAKNRTGPVGDLQLLFQNEFARFENLSVAQPPEV